MMTMIELTLCTEHTHLVERLKLEKDAELNSRLEQLEKQTATRIELLQQQHSETINALNAGNLPYYQYHHHYHVIVVVIIDTGIIVIITNNFIFVTVFHPIENASLFIGCVLRWRHLVNACEVKTHLIGCRQYPLG